VFVRTGRLRASASRLETSAPNCGAGYESHSLALRCVRLPDDSYDRSLALAPVQQGPGEIMVALRLQARCPKVTWSFVELDDSD